MFRFFSSVIVFSFVILASGCVTSPHWYQEFPSRTTQIPIQTWTPAGNFDVTITCSQAGRFGRLYPDANGNWQYVTTIETNLASYDTKGAAIYSAGRKMALPSYCWRYSDSSRRWHTALRASFLDANARERRFITFDKNGLACLGAQMGKDREIYNTSDRCHKIDSNGNAIYHVVFRAIN